MDFGAFILCGIFGLCVIGSVFVMLIARPISDRQKKFLLVSTGLFLLSCLYIYKVFYLDEGLTGLTMPQDNPQALRLLRLGADPNASGESGQTVLMGAIANNNPVLVKALIQKGANVNEKAFSYSNGWSSARVSPLQAALHGKNKQIIKLLRDAGAQP